MTDSDAIQKLIEELEQAETGSRALSDRVISACQFVPKGSINWAIIPSPTQSVDAALELVPEAPWPWNVTIASAYGSARVIPHHDDSRGIHDPFAGHSHAKTVPLALCAAILRARLSMESEKEAVG